MFGLVAAVAGALLLGGNVHGNLVDESKLAGILSKAVNKDGRVDYAGLKAHRAGLDEYLKAVAAVPRSQFDAASREAQIAYLLNASNGYLLQTIIDNYPKPVKNEGGLFGGPGNSIKQIKGVFNSLQHGTAVGNVTLDQIENDWLRKKFQEPLAQAALARGAKGSPPLRAEPYFADKLQAQLEDQAQAWLASPSGLVVKGQSVAVSSDFKTFRDDFAFVEKYCPDFRRPIVSLAVGQKKVGWIEYDWTLDEQTKK